MAAWKAPEDLNIMGKILRLILTEDLTMNIEKFPFWANSRKKINLLKLFGGIVERTLPFAKDKFSDRDAT